MKLLKSRIGILAASSAALSCIWATILLTGVFLPNHRLVSRPPIWMFFLELLVGLAYMFGVPVAVLYILTKQRRGPEAVVTYVVLAWWLGSMAWMSRIMANN